MRTFGVFLMIVALLLGLRVAAPALIKRELLSRMREGCPACRFEVRDIELAALKGEIIARGVGVLGDPAEGTHFGATAEAVTVDTRVRSLLGGKAPWIQAVRVEGLDLTVADYADSPPNKEPPSYPWLSKLPAAHVESIEVKDARFTYALDPREQMKVPNSPEIPDKLSISDALKGKKHRSYLTFHSIDASCGPFGTRRELSGDSVTASAEARQGESARVKVVARLGLYEREKDDEIEIWGTDARLADINTMFVPEQGIRLSGRLKQGYAKLEVRDRKLDARMTLDYGGLEVSYLTGHKGRSGVGAFFKQLLAKVVVDKNKPRDGKYGKTSSQVKLTQKRFDNVFTFLLGGLRESAFEIIQSG
jgi:hypothetical protein